MTVVLLADVFAYHSTCSAVVSSSCDGELNTAQLAHAHRAVWQPGRCEMTKRYTVYQIPIILGEERRGEERRGEERRGEERRGEERRGGGWRRKKGDAKLVKLKDN